MSHVEPADSVGSVPFNHEMDSFTDAIVDLDISMGDGRLFMRKPLGRPMRTPMGEYIVPKGGKPLTSLGDFLPAPSDYFPKVDLTKSAPPQYSIAGPYKASKKAYEASPADNDTAKGMTWMDKTVTLKEKGKTRPYDVRDDAHMNDSIGPSCYMVDHMTVGSEGPKYSIASRFKDGVNANIGPPNSMVQPVDTHGVDTPGPNYRPNSRYWGRGPKKSFGSSRKDQVTDAPGPADYNAEQPSDGPAFTLAKRLPPPLQCQQAVNKESPGPGSYELGTTVGKAVAKSISGRNSALKGDEVPAPNLYTLPDVINDSTTAATLTYRTFERAEGPHPGPTQYSVTDKNLVDFPRYSMRQQTRPCFPDILHYPITAKLHHNPGPGSYHSVDKRNVSANDGPKFSMGQRARSAKNHVPGPNKYHVKLVHKPDARRAPAFSMGKRFEPVNKKPGPGPAAYYPNTSTTQFGHSMTSRPQATKKFVTPAPNNYHLDKGQKCTGVFQGPKATFKSRASPYVYSGFHTTNVR